jgi:hypothetical protein
MTGPGDLQPPEFPQVQLLAIHTSNVTSSIPTVGLTNPTECDAKCASIATRNATPQASASGSTEPHGTTEPAATIQVAAGFLVPPASYRNLQAARGRAKKQPAGAMDGPAGVKKVAGTGTEQTRFHSGQQGVESVCDAECDSVLGDRVEVLARAVVLVAGMRIPEAAREAVLVRVMADLTSPTTRIPQWSSRAGEVLRSLPAPARDTTTSPAADIAGR